MRKSTFAKRLQIFRILIGQKNSVTPCLKGNPQCFRKNKTETIGNSELQSLVENVVLLWSD